MATLLRLIDEDELRADLDELVGDSWLVTLTLVQERYEAMVHAKLGDHRDSPAISRASGGVFSG